MGPFKFSICLWYIDPGSGFTFFQFGAVVLAAIAGAFTFLAFQMKRIIGFLKKIFSRKP